MPAHRPVAPRERRYGHSCSFFSIFARARGSSYEKSHNSPKYARDSLSGLVLPPVGLWNTLEGGDGGGGVILTIRNFGKKSIIKKMLFGLEKVPRNVLEL